VTRRLAAIAMLALAGLTLAACGVPLSAGPTRLPASAVPAGLLAETPSPQQSCSHSPRLKTVYIYLVEAFTGRLVRVARCVETRHSPTVQEVLKLLEYGPYGSDYQDNYGSALNVSSNLQSAGPRPTGVGPCPRSTTAPSPSGGSSTTTTAPPSTRCGLATIRLDRFFSELQGEAPIEELAQIVWSVTESLRVTEVRFLGADGRPVAVEKADGRFVDRPVTIADYRHVGI
jgi:hypothetical protein